MELKGTTIIVCTVKFECKVNGQKTIQVDFGSEKFDEYKK